MSWSFRSDWDQAADVKVNAHLVGDAGEGGASKNSHGKTLLSELELFREVRTPRARGQMRTTAVSVLF
jgi:hypothetical protein